MSTSKNPFPAFPIGPGRYYSHGMTLRDYFAAKALQGFAADPNMGPAGAEVIAPLAYAWADAMLAERLKAFNESTGD